MKECLLRTLAIIYTVLKISWLLCPWLSDVVDHTIRIKTGAALEVLVLVAAIWLSIQPQTPPTDRKFHHNRRHRLHKVQHHHVSTRL